RSIEVAVVREALADAGLTIADVDAVACCTGGIGMPSLELAEYLGIPLGWTDSTQTGGSSFELQLQHLVDAIAARHCETGLLVYAATPRSAHTRGGAGFSGASGQASMAASGTVAPRLEWEMPYGMLTPMGEYALAAARHMDVYGTRSEQLAQIAVSTRQWAA